MNISDLRGHLTETAEGIDSAEYGARADEVFAKVHATRIRRALTAGGVVAVAAAVAVVALVWLPGDNTSTPQPTKTFRLHTIRDHGIPFYTDPGGNRLLEHKVGRPGQSRVQISTMAPTGALFPVGVCTATYSEAHPYYVHIVVNGNPVITMGCAGRRELSRPEHAMFFASEEPITNTVGGIGFFDGVKPGLTMTMEAWISEGLDGSIVNVPGAQIGFALYGHEPDMVKEHDLWMARQVVVGDHTYALAARTFKDLGGGGGSATLELPQSQHRLLVFGGVESWSSPAHFTRMRGSEYSMDQATQAPETLDLNMESSSARTETISIQGKPGSTGFLYLLAYTRID